MHLCFCCRFCGYVAIPRRHDKDKCVFLRQKRIAIIPTDKIIAEIWICRKRNLRCIIIYTAACMVATIVDRLQNRNVILIYCIRCDKMFVPRAAFCNLSAIRPSARIPNFHGGRQHYLVFNGVCSRVIDGVFTAVQVVSDIVWDSIPTRSHGCVVCDCIAKNPIPLIERITHSFRSWLCCKTVFFHLLRLNFRTAVFIERNRINRSTTDKYVVQFYILSAFNEDIVSVVAYCKVYGLCADDV